MNIIFEVIKKKKDEEVILYYKYLLKIYFNLVKYHNICKSNIQHTFKSFDDINVI